MAKQTAIEPIYKEIYWRATRQYLALKRRIEAIIQKLRKDEDYDVKTALEQLAMDLLITNDLGEAIQDAEGL